MSLLPRPLPVEIKEIVVVLVDRATMARVHGEFLNDPTETDVITFPYGEILVCPAVAREQAPAHGSNLENEILLYTLHGLLHLVGFEDSSPTVRRTMMRAQDSLLKQMLSD